MNIYGINKKSNKPVEEASFVCQFVKTAIKRLTAQQANDLIRNGSKKRNKMFIIFLKSIFFQTKTYNK